MSAFNHADIAVNQHGQLGDCLRGWTSFFYQPRDASKSTANASAMKIMKKTGGSRTVIANVAALGLTAELAVITIHSAPILLSHSLNDGRSISSNSGQLEIGSDDSHG
jgi:hypothetical protein